MLKPIIKILSFDPGLTCTGWAISEYEIHTGKFRVLKRGKIEGKKALIKCRELLTLYTSRLIQLSVLSESVEELLKHNPDYVVTENAFHQPGRTSAYAALLLCIHEIEKTTMLTANLPLYKLAPRSVKQGVTTYGAADKTSVQEAILSNEYISVKETKQHPLDRMSEHEADAIGIGYTFAIETLLAKQSSKYALHQLSKKSA